MLKSNNPRSLVTGSVFRNIISAERPSKESDRRGVCACFDCLTESPRKFIVNNTFISAPVTVQSYKTAAADKDKSYADKHQPRCGKRHSVSFVFWEQEKRRSCQTAEARKMKDEEEFLLGHHPILTKLVSGVLGKI